MAIDLLMARSCSRALGEGPPQHFDHLLRPSQARVGISRRPAMADEKATCRTMQ
jgi:hypothetical protein